MVADEDTADADGASVAHAKTGRVFTVTKDVPAIQLVAASRTAYLESYANDLENGRFHVEEGFGGVYLERA